jgi:hypothetical protein
MKNRKSIKLIATTTASSIIISMTTACGTDEMVQTNQKQQTKEDGSSAQSAEKNPLRIKIKNTEGSFDTTRCIGSGRCVIQDN